jgi:hypothetical protein
MKLKIGALAALLVFASLLISSLPLKNVIFIIKSAFCAEKPSFNNNHLILHYLLHFWQKTGKKRKARRKPHEPTCLHLKPTGCQAI